jgi:branched-chain amino acid transport system permease protein
VDTFLANEILVFVLFAVGFHLLMGYGGEISFGHAMFFGTAAYLTVYLMLNGVGNLYIAMGLAVVVTTLLSLVIGYVSLRQRGLAFALVTLAFGQMFYTVAFSWTDLTGGDNGLLLPRVETGIVPINPAEGGLEFYLFTAIVLTILLVAVRRVINSRFGRVLVAVRENEARATHLGYETGNYLLVAFVMSAFVSSVAGSLYAVLLALVDPSLLFWSMSGEVLLMSVFGGVGTFAGPIFGAPAFILLEEFVTDIFGNWQIVYGTLIILVVLFFPNGVYGTLVSDGDGIREVLGRLRR